MRAGDLRHLICIEEALEEQNEFGEPVESSWVAFADAWAAKEDLTGREAFLAQQVKAEVTTRFTIRYLGGITAKMRIRAGALLYSIESVQDPDGRGRMLHLIAARLGDAPPSPKAARIKVTLR